MVLLGKQINQHHRPITYDIEYVDGREQKQTGQEKMERKNPAWKKKTEQVQHLKLIALR